MHTIFIANDISIFYLLPAVTADSTQLIQISQVKVGRLQSSFFWIAACVYQRGLFGNNKKVIAVISL
jgi:hypothetical protein